MFRINDATIRTAADMLIDMHGEQAAQVVEQCIAEACRTGDGMGSVAWSIIGTAVRQQLDGASPSGNEPRWIGDPEPRSVS